MLSKYKPNFETLTPEEAGLIASKIFDANPDNLTGDALFTMCEERHLDHARVVMSLANDPTAIGVSAIEKLVGKPITKKQKTAPAAKAERKPRPVLRDDRIIRLLVDKNPKKQGSKTYERFELYRDGMTVQEFRQAGGTSDDVKWDAQRGFIRVEDASNG